MSGCCLQTPRGSAAASPDHWGGKGQIPALCLQNVLNFSVSQDFAYKALFAVLFFNVF